MQLKLSSSSLAPSPALPSDISSSQAPRSTLVSRNVTIANHRTSVRLEPEMWSGLSEICRREGGSLHEVCTAVANRKKENTSLTAAIRVFVMAYYRAAATEEGHTKSGHGYGISPSIGSVVGNRPTQPPALVSVPSQSMIPNAASPQGRRLLEMNGINRGGFR